MLNNLLSKFGANTKITVGVAVTPGIGLEMIEIDKGTKTVSKYASRPLEYNFSTREIVNYDEFRSALATLFDELKIPRNSNIILTLPTVHFGIISLPIMLSEEAVTNAIISEVEQTYIFKRQEPVVSWTNVVTPNQSNESTQVLYSAIQNNALAEIYASCLEVGCTLLNVETSYLSLLKALSYTNFAQDQMKDFVTWNLMIIGQNNYSILSMSGKNVISYYEEPIALKSFTGEEVYNAIISSSTLTLTTNPANWLYIISETDMVSAEVLSNKISFDGQVTYLETNKYVQKPLIDTGKNIMPNVALKITPEIIGSGIYQISDYPIKLNMIGEFKADNIETEINPTIHIGNLEIELSPAFIKKMALLGVGVFLVPIILIFLILNTFCNKFQQESYALDSKISGYESEMKQYEGLNVDTFDENTEISFINAKNKERLIYYEALGLSIPDKTWITNFRITNKDKVFISGKTPKLEDIYNFYRDLKMSVINSDIKVNTLEAVENDDSESTGIPKFYNFEITNMSSEENFALKEEKRLKDVQNNMQQAREGDKEALEKLDTSLVQPVSDNQTPPPSGSPSANSGLPPNLEKIESF